LTADPTGSGRASVLDRVHGRWVHGRRVRVLSAHLAELAPTGARVLDVGCGDGLVGSLIRERRPDLQVTGIDVVVRGRTHIPVTEFDGASIPHEDASVDVVMLVDVMHHAEAPLELLREARRVAARALLVKDVALSDPLARATLTFMDWVGNARHGVPLPYNFWTPEEWRSAFDELGVEATGWRERIGLYPSPFGLLFERRMHFITLLEPRDTEVGA
jgi:SAM-dependent methyltransferase